jgi:hypothetical protein
MVGLNIFVGQPCSRWQEGSLLYWSQHYVIFWGMEAASFCNLHRDLCGPMATSLHWILFRAAVLSCSRAEKSCIQQHLVNSEWSILCRSWGRTCVIQADLIDCLTDWFMWCLFFFFERDRVLLCRPGWLQIYDLPTPCPRLLSVEIIPLISTITLSVIVLHMQISRLEIKAIPNST